jgi:hypothetical protein
MAVDFKSLSKNDQGALISGVLAVIFTFIGSYITVSSGSVSAGHNAWDGFGVLGSLLLIAALALVAVRIFAPDTLPAGVPWNLITLAVAAIATIILVIKGLTFSPDGLPASVDSGPGWSGWVLFVLAIVFTVFAALLFKESGEKMPEVNKKDTPPAA